MCRITKDEEAFLILDFEYKKQILRWEEEERKGRKVETEKKKKRTGKEVEHEDERKQMESGH